MESVELLKQFGDQVRKLRTERGISQEKLAELCELHRTYISTIERGKRNVSLVNIHAIAKALQIPMDELLKFE